MLIDNRERYLLPPPAPVLSFNEERELHIKLAADIVRHHRLTISVRHADELEEERTDDLFLRFSAETSRTLLRYLVSGEESTTGAGVDATLYKLQVPVSLLLPFIFDT